MKATNTLSAIDSLAHVLLMKTENVVINNLTDSTSFDLLNMIRRDAQGLNKQLVANLETVKLLIKEGKTESAIDIIDTLLY